MTGKRAKPTEEAATAALAGRELAAAHRILKARKARDSLIEFTEFTMPDVVTPDDATKTRYSAQYFHKALAAALEEVEKGNLLRLIITFPPRHGKSELTSRRFPAWLLGRDPYRHIIFGTYNQEFSEDYGRDVRGIIESDQYRQVFPGTTLAKGSKAADRLATEQGGKCFFVGRGGSSTGRGADFLIIDDPLKDRKEAQSATIRKELWDWYQDTMSSRLMSDLGAIIIIMTRWHEDDLVGRLTDPSNPHYQAEEAAQWKIINIPAIAEEDDVLNRRPGEALWPERFGIEWLERKRLGNPVGFSALYQQRPTPAEGDFFRKEYLPTYRAENLPKKLRVYAASDHAVGTKQTNDRNCLLIVGVDEHDVIWLLDCWWKRAKADETVEAMIRLMKRWKPVVWWAEGGHISKSIGPFLQRRMREEKVYINIREQTPAGDKEQRAQSINGRAAMGMVRFPAGAPWTQDAIDECLKFPGGRNDDFVDALAHIGLGLHRLLKAPVDPEKKPAPARGTFGWVKAEAAAAKKAERIKLNLAGW
jgi:predicted phage terminase large subunit-like protein